ncbi:MAG: hypothetical protein IKA56_01230 [Clostridia bacterium]|nr:hypothetical protein [Clostridia bacterium]
MNTEKIFEKYGLSATLCDYTAEKVVNLEFNAFVQALRYKNKIYLRGTYTELGKNQQDYYLYIGPPDIDVSNVDGAERVLTINGISYMVDRTEKHYIGNTNIYNWAIIRPIVVYEVD